MENQTSCLLDDDENDGQWIICPECDGAATFRTINPETKEVNHITCKFCRGERLVKRSVPETLQ